MHISMNSNPILETTICEKLKMVKKVKESAVLSIIDMHQKFTHLPPSAFTMLSKHITSLLPLLKNDDHFDCSACTKAKMVRTIPKTCTSSKASLLYELVYADICRPFSMKIPISSQYYVSFLDDNSYIMYL